VIELKLNGKPLPAALLAGIPYTIEILADGFTPIFAGWSITAASVTVAEGTGNISFTPASAVTHYITVSVLKPTGYSENAIFSVGVSTTRNTVPTITAVWGKLGYTHGEEINAEIIYGDPEGLPPQSITWVLYHNNIQRDTGTTTQLKIAAAQFGLYRLRVTCVDAVGATVIADSTVKVEGGFAQQASISPTQPTGTLQLLGYVYSKPINAGEVSATYLPFEVASHYQVVSLLPGTTHFKLSIDPNNATVDDELVVRLRNGNWALIGPPSGLSTEDIGYDYLIDRTYIPAPADLRAKATFDVWNTSGSTASATTSIVRFECYREGVPIYEYSPCTYSEFPGGTAARQRRMAVLFTSLSVDLDANNILVNTSFPTSTYTTANSNTFLGRLSASGSPDTVLPHRGLSFTESNMYAIYTSESGNEPLEAFGVYGTDETRPFVVCFTKPGSEAVVRRVRRVYGKMAVYVSGGGMLAGSYVTATIALSRAPGSITYNVPVLEDVYNSNLDEYVKVGEIDVDVTDYGFSQGGVEVRLKINE
jgi:hypothetical protein